MLQKIILKMLVAILFLGATIFVVDKLNNQGYVNVSMELDEPELPVVYCSYQGTMLNCLAGYKQIMDTNLMRESIVPLNENGGVEFLVDDRYAYATGYSYELRSISDNSLIEYGDLALSNSQKFNGYTKFDIIFRMDTKLNQEYVVVFKIHKGENESVNYYTRVVRKEQEYVNAMLSYALEFNNATFKKENPVDENNIINHNLKYDELETSDDLSQVSLYCTYDTITWAGLKPTRITSLVPRLIEVDDAYAVFCLEYTIMSNVGEKEAYYNVDEYYSLAYDINTQKVEILAYDRYQESIFDETEVSKSDNGFKIGIAREDNIKFKSTKDNMKVAIVRERQLWFYDYNEATINNVFSFWNNDSTDVRTNNRNMDINIMEISDNGDIKFAVYGYMSRGNHEGENGIALYKYNNEDRTVSELVFIECQVPFDVMKEEVGRFTYYDNDEEKFYYLLDEAIYLVDLANDEQIQIVSGLPTSYIKTSRSMSVIAYPNTDIVNEVTTINLYNFKNRQNYQINASGNQKIMAVGFVGEDLICGHTNNEDIIMSSNGETIFPMTNIEIISNTGETIKEYNKNGIYVMDAYLDGEVIYLDRATKNGNFYTTIEPDYISYKQNIEEATINLKHNYTEEKLKQKYMVFPANIYVQTVPELTISKYKKDKEGKQYETKSVVRNNSFFIFDNTGYKGEYFSAGKCISQVQGTGGVVIDGNGNTIFRQIAGKGYNTVADKINETPCEGNGQSLMACAYMCLELYGSDATFEEVKQLTDWNEAFELYSNKVGVNISGITLDSALYFLDRDVPFAAQLEDGRFVLVISYNDESIRYYDPVEASQIKVDREVFENSISFNKNTMYTFAK